MSDDQPKRQRRDRRNKDADADIVVSKPEEQSQQLKATPIAKVVAESSRTPLTPLGEGDDANASQLFQKLLSVTTSQEDWKNAAFVWVKDDTDGFVVGEVKKTEGDTHEVVTTNGQIVYVKKNEIFPMNPPHLEGVEDMARLTHLNEAGVLNNLKFRYSKDNIYTYSGLFCCVINPYKQILGLYTPEMVQKYQGRNREDVPPHVFSVADLAYRGMLQSKCNQSMLVTGESGAGKTENTKKIIQYLTSVAGAKGGGGEIEKRLLSTNPLLEAFGNARTIKNDNSSRFGKFIEINFNAAGFIVGTTVQNYLLETTRVINQHANERNFHIFYQILADPQLRAKYNLTSADDFPYLNHSGCTRIEGVDDKDELQSTIVSMQNIGITDKEKDFIFETIAGVLHLGKINIVDGAKTQLAQIDDKEPVKDAANMLQVSPKNLEKALIKPLYKTINEVVERHETAARAQFNRDALVKSIYRRLFNYIVMRVNESLSTKEAVKTFIGVLDIAGFEIFPLNSFEQLCINFTNEKLQQFFNHHMFVKEQEIYQAEKIEWDYMDFGLDLQPTIDLIEKSGGLLSILDDQVVAKSTDDQKLRDEYVRKWGKSAGKIFKENKFEKKNFTLLHYAGEVDYNVDQWLYKNQDPMNEDCAKVMYESKSSYISSLFKDYVDATKKKSGANFQTVAKEYRLQLSALVDKLSATEPHFIRCIIPNLLKKSGILDAQLILHQLKCNGVLEGIRISRKGYPGRIAFKDFIQRYNLLCSQNELQNEKLDKSKADIILKKSNLEYKTEYMIGLTRVFLKAGVEAKLEQLRNVYVDKICVVIQGAGRGYLARNNYKKLQEQVNAIRLVQDNWRAYLKLKSWSWWELFSRSRPMIEVWKKEEERRKQLKAIEELKAQIKTEQEARQKTEQEKKDLQNDVLKLQADIETLYQKSSALDNEMNNIQGKHRDWESTLENLKREKQMNQVTKEKLLKALRNKEEELKLKEKEIDALNTQLKEGNNAQTMLQNQIRDMTTAKLKFEAQGKRLNEELVETKQRLAESAQKAAETEREKNNLDDRIKETNYRLEVIETEKTNLDRRKNDIQKDASELEKKIKKAKQDLEALRQGNANKDTNLAQLQNDLSDAKKKLEDIQRQKKQLDTVNQELTSTLQENEKKRNDLERQLRDVRDEGETLKQNIEKITEIIHKLEDQSKNDNSELADLKARLQKALDLKATLEKTKGELDKELADQRFALQELKDKTQRETDLLNKRIADVDRDLNDQIAAMVSQKNSLDRKLRDLQRTQKDGQKAVSQLQAERDNLDAQYRKLEASLTQEQGDTINEKKKLAELENLRKDLATKIADLENRLRMDLDNTQKLDLKRRELQNLIDSQRDKIESLEKERNDLAAEKADNLKQQTQLGLDVTDLTNQIQNLQMKGDQDELELLTLKQRLEEGNAQLVKLRDEGKVLEGNLNELLQQYEAARNDKSNLIRKLQRLEDQIAALKKRIDEELAECKKEYDARSLIEQELRDKKTQLDTDVHTRDELEKKLKAIEAKLQDMQKIKDETSGGANKLKLEEATLMSQVSTLQEEVEELEAKLRDGEMQDKDLRDRVADSERKKDEVQKQKAKNASDNSRLKSEIEIQKQMDEQNQKKAEAAIESLRRKIEVAEQEYDQKVRQLNDEKEEMKKELKSLTKKVDTTQGMVSKEVLHKLTTDFQLEVDRIRREVDEERKAKSQAEATKRALEFQIVTLKDNLEQEERLKKKATLQKKQIQMEIDELKEMANEADDLNDELEKYKADADALTTELKNEMQRERNARQAAETTLLKMQRELQEIKKSLSDATAADAEQVRKLKEDYESQLVDLEDQLNREQRGKKSIGSSAKKSERQIRDMERNLQRVEKDKLQYEDRFSSLYKDTQRLKEDLQSDQKKAAQAESTNKLLIRELDNYKNKLRDLEESTQKLREDRLRKKSKPLGRQAVNVDDDDDEQ